jgi:phosphoglycolate phosphatase
MSAQRFSIDAVLFDLDGTLLDTVNDLGEAANRMLADMVRPQRSLEEVHSYVGKGIPNLVRRCMTDGCEATEADLDAVLIAIGLEVERLGGRQVLLAVDAGQRHLELSLPGRDPDPDPVK